jgi:hypothetical protein
MLRLSLPLLATVAGLFLADPVPAMAEAQAGVASANDTARVLAGLPPSPGSPLEAVTREAGWQKHAKSFDVEWANLSARQLSKTRAWSETNLGESRATLFYMFSGPDFLYADSFFPTASTYVMSGLEPVGRLPDLMSIKPSQLPQVLGDLKASLSDVLSRSYFITSHMDQKLRRGQLAGVLPVLYVFLARTGKTIEDVSYVTLQPDGTLKPFEASAPPTAPKAVKIAFRSKEGRDQTLYFFSTNLANKGVAESGFLKFCESLGTGDAFVKSASYLPHGSEFATVREFITRQARILQDDTGPPLRFYKESEWRLQAFGVYTRPIPPFTNSYQQTMKALFDRQKPKPLGFSYGYRWRNDQSHMLLATRLTPQASDQTVQPGPSR